MRDDVKAAIRSLRKSPGFTIVALAILALGISSATTMFSVVDAVVLRGLPFDEYDRILAIRERDPVRPTTFGGGDTTAQTYLHWKGLSRSFESLAAVSRTTFFSLKTESGEPEDPRGLRVTREFFTALRVQPVLGRAFTADDEGDAERRTAILSYGFWQRRFGGTPDALGKTIVLNDQPWEVVGVMPRGFSYPVRADQPTEIYTPIVFTKDDRVHGNNRNFNYTVFGRLKPGISGAQAQDEMTRINAAVDKEFPKWMRGCVVDVMTLHEMLVGKVRAWMLMLLGAVGLVLLIACANVANLMLARATVRAREIGVRAALGASRWRLVRGLLAEGVVLSLIAALIGVALAIAGVRLVVAWMPPSVPKLSAIAVDLRVLCATMAAAVGTGVLFGIAPALQASRPDLTSALKDSARGATAGARTQRLRSALVVGEVALASILLVGAGLFISSFTKLMAIDAGFDYHRVLALNLGGRFLSNLTADERVARSRAYTARVLETVRGVPGVDSLGVVNGGLPLSGSWSRNNLTIPGREELKGDDGSIDRRTVTPGYLQVLRIPLRRGRYLSEEDREGSQPVVVINQTAARKYWPGEEALGQRVILNQVERIVVGIVGDIRHLGPEIPPRQEAYLPLVQTRDGTGTLTVRTTIDPLAVLPRVKAAIWSINRDQHFPGDVFTLEGYMDRLVAQRRFNMALLAIFGFIGLAIAAAGIYGVLAYIVAQRTSEIGIRMTLGATASNVTAMIVTRAAVLIATGLAIGGAGAWYLSAGVKAFLFEVQPTDPRVFVAALVTLAVSGLAASAVPARRAASVDPLVALRQE
jgi:putative ABC transport system permease protein